MLLSIRSFGNGYPKQRIRTLKSPFGKKKKQMKIIQIDV